MSFVFLFEALRQRVDVRGATPHGDHFTAVEVMCFSIFCARCSSSQVWGILIPDSGF